MYMLARVPANPLRVLGVLAMGRKHDDFSSCVYSSDVDYVTISGGVLGVLLLV